MRSHTFDAYDFAYHFNRTRFDPSTSFDVYRHGSAGIAAKSIDGILQGHVFGRFVVDAHDDIAGFDARFPSGCAFHGRDDDEIFVAHADDETATGKAAVARHDVFECVRWQ